MFIVIDCPTYLIEKQRHEHKRVAAFEDVKLFIQSEIYNFHEKSNHTCRNLGKGVLVIEEENDRTNKKKHVVLKKDGFWLNIPISEDTKELYISKDRYVSLEIDKARLEKLESDRDIPDKVKLLLIFKEKGDRDDFLAELKKNRNV